VFLFACRDSVVGGPAAQLELERGLAVMPQQRCGLQLGDKRGAFVADGRLTYLRSEGHWECSPSCTRDRCKLNRFIR
jgi:hypothetical protein